MTAVNPTLEQGLAETKRIVLRGLAGFPVRVCLFGSRATGTARRTSNIDVAVWPLTELPIGTSALIREALEESSVIYTVDLVDLRDTDEAFRARVLAEGIAWQEDAAVGERRDRP